MAGWQDQATIHGVAVKVCFFEAAAVEKAALPRRLLPFLRDALPRVLFTEGDRRNVRYGELVAQPDAVLEHGNGLVCVEYKSFGQRPHSPEGWQREVRLKDMLQCLLAGYAVAQHYRTLTGCILRYHNACYQLCPPPSVIDEMLNLLPMAKNYYREAQAVSASQLAQFSVERIRTLHPGPADDRMARGRAAHAALLRR